MIKSDHTKRRQDEKALFHILHSYVIFHHFNPILRILRGINQSFDFNTMEGIHSFHSNPSKSLGVTCHFYFWNSCFVRNVSQIYLKILLTHALLREHKSYILYIKRYIGLFSFSFAHKDRFRSYVRR